MLGDQNNVIKVIKSVASLDLVPAQEKLHCKEIYFLVNVQL